MIVLSFASSCCCYLPIDFHHRLFRKWHTVYHESFEAEKFHGFRGFLVLRETFFHENISVAVEKRALIAITMGIRESFFVKICVMH